MKMAKVFRTTLNDNPDLMVEYNPNNIDAARCNAMFTVEGGAAINGKPERLQELKDLGVRIFSLVWSEENELAGGVNTDVGLKPAGIRTVQELERLGMILDVSHLNTKGFWQLCDIAKKPFIATHSNAIAVGPHARNLADDQVKEILTRGGIIGLTYCMPFIHARTDEDASYDDMARQIEHMLNLGAENQLCLGSDFDGAKVPSAMNGIETMPAFIDFIEGKFGAPIAQKISFENANNFFKNNWAF
ncbi:membrane dipeptidase [Ruminococcaceae bacterium OttesenSCG-928-N02]|nr:membrane dipeptidase [Ruminococcaceae bacterium OttesenSCG-928-N02]